VVLQPSTGKCGSGLSPVPASTLCGSYLKMRRPLMSAQCAPTAIQVISKMEGPFRSTCCISISKMRSTWMRWPLVMKLIQKLRNTSQSTSKLFRNLRPNEMKIFLPCCLTEPPLETAAPVAHAKSPPTLAGHGTHPSTTALAWASVDRPRKRTAKVMAAVTALQRLLCLAGSELPKTAKQVEGGP